MIPSLKGWPTQAKEAPSLPTGHQPSISKSRGKIIGILSKLRNRASLKILKMTYSLFCSHLLYGSQLRGQSNITSQNKIQKLQIRALRKILFQKSKILLVKHTRNYKSWNFLIFCIYKTIFLCPRLKQIEDWQTLLLI